MNIHSPGTPSCVQGFFCVNVIGFRDLKLSSLGCTLKQCLPLILNGQ
jgi:hypothetical protein